MQFRYFFYYIGIFLTRTSDCAQWLETHDDTLSIYSRGIDVVDATMQKVRYYLNFDDDADTLTFWRRIALIESNAGMAVDYDPNDGLWKFFRLDLRQNRVTVTDLPRSDSSTMFFFVMAFENGFNTCFLCSRSNFSLPMISATYARSLMQHFYRSNYFNVSTQAYWWKEEYQFTTNDLSEELFIEKALTYDIETGCRDDLKADIWFLVDSSTSVSDEELQKSLDFLDSLASRFTVSPSKVQLGLSIFHLDHNIIFPFTQSTNLEMFQRVLGEIARPETSPHTGNTLEKIATQNFNASVGGRSDAVNMLFVITNAKSADDVDAYARQLKDDDDFVIFSVGIGTDIEQIELENMATSPLGSHVITKASFDELADSNFLSEQKEQICKDSIAYTIYSWMKSELSSNAGSYSTSATFLAQVRSEFSFSCFPCSDAAGDRIVRIADHIFDETNKVIGSGDAASMKENLILWQEDHYDDCNIGQTLDLWFLLDNAETYTDSEYEAALDFVYDVVRLVSIPISLPPELRVGYSVSFAIEHKTYYRLDQTRVNQAGFLRARDSAFKPISKSNAGKAITQIEQLWFSDSLGGRVDDDEVGRFLVLLTDSKSYDDVIEASRNISSKNVTIISIGIGDQVNFTELNEIHSTQPYHGLTVSSFDDLASLHPTVEADIHRQMYNRICNLQIVIPLNTEVIVPLTARRRRHLLVHALEDKILVIQFESTATVDGKGYLSAIIPEPNSAFYDFAFDLIEGIEILQIKGETLLERYPDLEGTNSGNSSDNWLNLYISVVNDGNSEIAVKIFAYIISEDEVESVTPRIMVIDSSRGETANDSVGMANDSEGMDSNNQGNSSQINSNPAGSNQSSQGSSENNSTNVDDNENTYSNQNNTEDGNSSAIQAQDDGDNRNETNSLNGTLVGNELRIGENEGGDDTVGNSDFQTSNDMSWLAAVVAALLLSISVVLFFLYKRNKKRKKVHASNLQDSEQNLPENAFGDGPKELPETLKNADHGMQYENDKQNMNTLALKVLGKGGSSSTEPGMKTVAEKVAAEVMDGALSLMLLSAVGDKSDKNTHSKFNPPALSNELPDGSLNSNFQEGEKEARNFDEKMPMSRSNVLDVKTPQQTSMPEKSISPSNENHLQPDANIPPTSLKKVSSTRKAACVEELVIPKTKSSNDQDKLASLSTNEDQSTTVQNVVVFDKAAKAQSIFNKEFHVAPAVPKKNVNISTEKLNGLMSPKETVCQKENDETDDSKLAEGGSADQETIVQPQVNLNLSFPMKEVDNQDTREHERASISSPEGKSSPEKDEDNESITLEKNSSLPSDNGSVDKTSFQENLDITHNVSTQDESADVPLTLNNSEDNEAVPDDSGAKDMSDNESNDDKSHKSSEDADDLPTINILDIQNIVDDNEKPDSENNPYGKEDQDEEEILAKNSGRKSSALRGVVEKKVLPIQMLGRQSRSGSIRAGPDDKLFGNLMGRHRRSGSIRPDAMDENLFTEMARRRGRSDSIRGSFDDKQVPRRRTRTDSIRSIPTDALHALRKIAEANNPLIYVEESKSNTEDEQDAAEKRKALAKEMENDLRDLEECAYNDSIPLSELVRKKKALQAKLAEFKKSFGSDKLPARARKYIEAMERKLIDITVYVLTLRLTRAIQFRDGTKLKAGLDAVDSCIQEELIAQNDVDDAPNLTANIKRAKDLLALFEQLERMKSVVLSLKQTTISEVRSYSNPPPAIRNVMEATFVLLGEEREKLKNWKVVQGLVGRTGKDAIKRRVTERNVLDISYKDADAANLLVKDLVLEEVEVVSKAASVFFTWVLSVEGEVRDRLTNAQAVALEEPQLVP